MGYIKGFVTKVYVGDPQEPKQEGWSKSAKFGLQIDGKWWNGYVNQDKQSGAFTVKDKDYAVVSEGSEVEFMTTTNVKDGREYENMDKKTLKVTGGTQQAPPIQENEKPAPMQTPPVHTVVPTEIRAELLKIYYNGLAAMQALSKFNAKDFPKDTLSHIERVAAHIRKTMEK